MYNHLGVIAVNVADTVRKTIKEQGITLGELAEKVNWSPQNLSNKMSRANFSESEIRAIAEALGAEAEISIVVGKHVMKPFQVVKDRRHTVIPGMTAENDDYILKWTYDGDYAEDFAGGKLNLCGIICELRGKRPHLPKVLYIPGTGDPTIDYATLGVKLGDVYRDIEALQTAARAAELAVEFMEPYIR